MRRSRGQNHPMSSDGSGCAAFEDQREPSSRRIDRREGYSPSRDRDETESPGHRPGLFVAFIAPSAFAGKLPPASFKLFGLRRLAGAVTIDRFHPFCVIGLDERLAFIRKLGPVMTRSGVRSTDVLPESNPFATSNSASTYWLSAAARFHSPPSRTHGRPCRWFSPGHSAFPAHRRRESRPPKPSRRRRCRGCRCWCVA